MNNVIKYRVTGAILDGDESIPFTTMSAANTPEEAVDAVKHSFTKLGLKFDDKIRTELVPDQQKLVARREAVGSRMER